jgi:hypothetical protein
MKDDVIDKIKFTLRCFVDLAFTLKFKNETEWTINLKEEIGKLGIQYGYSVRASGFDKEWLYDIVWCKKDINGSLTSVSLVVESEWKRSLIEISYDFEKLLLSNSPIKLMICQAYTNKNRRSY